MVRSSPLLLLLLSPIAHADPREDAVVALAEGRDAQAVQVLAAGIASGGEEAASLRCLLGQVELRTGRTQAALDTFSAVGAGAPCAMRATWGRAEALLALGRADEAGLLFAQVGEEALGPNRDARTVARLSDLADRVLARETPGVAQAMEALTLALQLAVDDATALKLARRLADLLAEHRVYSGGEAALPALAAAVQRDGEAADKRRLARLVGGDDGLELLSDLPADPETQTLRIELGRRRDLGWQVAQLDRLIEAYPDHRATREARLSVGRSLALAGWRVEAERVLAPLAQGQGDDAAKATRSLAELALRAGDELGAIALLDGLLARSPHSAEASWATAQRGAALQRAAQRAAGSGDAAQALALYTRLEQGGDPDAAYAAGLMARQLGDLPEATRRLEAIPARWPETSAARSAVWALFHMRARDNNDPDGAVAWLEGRAEAGLVDAEAVRAELSAPVLAVESAGGDAARPSVRVLARGYEQVELRLHRVDLEAWLRASGTLESLPQLDLGVIEPDRRWSVPVPNAHPQRLSDVELPVDLPGPGLYAVTVASTDREAQTLLLRSRTRVVGERIGPKVAIAVFADGKPVSGARVLLQDGATVLEARTDATGLALVEHRGGSLIVLAEGPQGPALTTLAAVVDDEPARGTLAGVDFDRALYRPGDTLGFRVAVDRAEPTERRDWSFWLTGDAGFGALVRQEFEERADGTIVGELPIPLASTGHRGAAAGTRTLTLMARRPDGTELSLGSARVADVVPEGRRLDLKVDGQQATMRLREEDGRPAAGVRVAWTWSETGAKGQVVTDAAGQALVDGPPAGVPWTLEASLPGTTLVARAWTPTADVATWSVTGERDRLRAGEPLRLTVEGAGEAHLRVVRLHAAVELPELVEPWALEPRWTDGLAGVVAWPTPGAWDPPSARETTTEQTLSLSGSQRVELPPLAEGRYLVELVAVDGRASADAWSVAVDGDPLRLLTPQAAGLGLPLTLAVEGEPALVMVRSNEQVTARVVLPGQSAVVPGSAGWRERVQLLAVGAAGGRHQLNIPVEAALRTTVAVDGSGPEWTVKAQVLDAGGAPVRAQVAIRLVDVGLEPRVGRARSLGEGPQRGGVSWSDASGWGGALQHGAWSTAISAALLDEVAREEEARRAQSALSGHLMNNGVQAALGEDVPLSEGLGGLGMSGYGSGGGGYGRGGGSMGAGGSGGVGSSREERPLQGTRERLLWAVLDTDERGLVQLSAPRPSREGRYRVEVVAVASGWVARAEQELAVDATQAVAKTQGPTRSPLAALALEADPAAPFDAGRAAIAARSALAALPLLSGQERAAALQRAIALVGALNTSPSAYRSVGEAAQALAALAELGEHFTLPRGTLQGFDAAINVEGATQADRVALAWARARAGLPVDDASVARLLREPERLNAEESSQLARTLILLGRRADARPLVLGEGPQALLAERELASNARERKRLAQGAAVQALLSGAPPPLGDPARPAWIAALPSSPSALVPAMAATATAQTACALRLPLAADGLVVRAPTPPPRAGGAGCGAAAHVAVGDALRVEGSLVRVALPTGVERLPDPDGVGFLLRATAPGSYALHGIERGKETLSLALNADGATLDPLEPSVALALAREALAGGRDVGVWLDARPRLEDWQPNTRAEVAGVRFRSVAKEGAAAVDVVTAFEDLRDEDPRGSLSFEEVLITAHAYQELRPERAMAVQRAAIGAAFLDEAGIASRLEQVLGPLASIQVLAEIAERYPPVPEVEHALYELPTRVLAIDEGGSLPPELRKVGVTPTDLRLMSAAWNREFVALYPASELAPFAGQRLVVDLLRLGAWDPAATWGERFGARFPQTELADNFAYLEGLARSGAGESRRASTLLRKVVRQRFLQADGREGPSEMKDDAELALARILEADGDREGALRAYEAAAGSLGDASASLALLRREDMELSDLVLLDPREPAILPVTVAGVDSLFLRAYRLDLRTLFLRDGGLSGAADVQVAGISPAWSGARSVPNRPFPREHELRLPLSEPGAWLVQVSAGGQASSVLVVRSELELVASDAGGVRRVTVLRGGKPAAGVAVRALGPSGVVAAVTDQRGAALVPAFAPTLAVDGANYAFTRSEGAYAVDFDFEGGDDLLDRVDQGLKMQRSAPSRSFDDIGAPAPASMEASAL